MITQKDIDYVTKIIKVFNRSKLNEKTNYDFTSTGHSIILFNNSNLITTIIMKEMLKYFTEISVTDNYFNNIPDHIKVVVHLETITK